MNHTRFPKEDHLPYWALRDYKITKGDRVDSLTPLILSFIFINLFLSHFHPGIKRTRSVSKHSLRLMQILWV